MINSKIVTRVPFIGFWYRHKNPCLHIRSCISIYKKSVSRNNLLLLPVDRRQRQAPRWRWSPRSARTCPLSDVRRPPRWSSAWAVRPRTWRSGGRAALTTTTSTARSVTHRTWNSQSKLFVGLLQNTFTSEILLTQNVLFITTNKMLYLFNIRLGICELTLPKFTHCQWWRALWLH